MPANYDSIDLAWTWNGDFDLGSDGDLKDTSDDALLSLRQELMDIAASAVGDWELYEGKGASLDDYVGEPNTRRTGNQIHNRLRLAILSAGIVDEEDLRIRVVPVDRSRVLILVAVDVIATPVNGMKQGEPVVIQLLHDSLEQSGVFFLDRNPNYIGNNTGGAF